MILSVEASGMSSNSYSNRCILNGFSEWKISRTVAKLSSLLFKGSNFAVALKAFPGNKLPLLDLEKQDYLQCKGATILLFKNEKTALRHLRSQKFIDVLSSNHWTFQVYIGFAKPIKPICHYDPFVRLLEIQYCQ